MSKLTQAKAGVFGISFDGVPMSGVVVEFLKIADLLHANNYTIYFDLGYEIKSDKNNFYKEYQQEKFLLPAWINLIKVLPEAVEDYSPEFITSVFNYVINPELSCQETEKLIQKYTAIITDKLIKLWTQLNIHIVIIENGTLPENIIFTRALLEAITLYGKQNNLHKFVIWRDHDLMWSSEFMNNKYGYFPYPKCPKIKPNPFINYFVLNEIDREAMLKWCPEVDVTILPNQFSIKRKDLSTAPEVFRNHFHIPKDAYMIARFTRIIPQKRIDRDIVLLRSLMDKLDSKKIYLCIAGDTKENAQEYTNLKNLTKKLSLEESVIFTGVLQPACIANQKDIFNIQSLIWASDLCSFLSSYDYESFGNPISEAISHGVPFIATTYERYQHVYGDKDYKGVLLQISAEDREINKDTFVDEVFRLLIDKQLQEKIVKHNLAIMSKRNSSLLKTLTHSLNIQLKNNNEHA